MTTATPYDMIRSGLYFHAFVIGSLKSQYGVGLTPEQAVADLAEKNPELKGTILKRVHQTVYATPENVA